MIKKLSLPVQLCLVIGVVCVFGGIISLSLMRLFYTFSTMFKEILCFMLPLIIFSFVVNGVLLLKKNAPFVLAVMIGMIFISNFCVALSVYGIMKCIEPFLASSDCAHELISNGSLEPFFLLKLPTIIKSEFALLSALIVGLFFSYFQSVMVEKMIEKMKKSIEWFLMYCFVPLLPIYIFGFLLQMRYEGMLILLIKQYGTTFFLIVGVQICYLMMLYFGMTGFSFKKTREAIINAMPSYLTAFGTMSSTLTVPVSIECAVKNNVNRPLAHIAMPIMANLHLLGDSVGTPILAMVTMYLFSGFLPNFEQYFSFVIYFCTAMFAVSGIPGGGILVMIPVLISAFNFTPAMVGIVTTLYFLMDSFGTAANVMGDGALVIGVHRIVRRFI
jgi:Na+/H+-dicarboxylate symporter